MIGYFPTPTLTRKQVDRLFRKVEFREDGCWIWRGETTKFGYGHVTINRHRWKPHRIVYALCVGAIPDGLQLDHLCHDPEQCLLANTCPHRRCVNPDHLRPATAGANTARRINASSRRTHCPKGHTYDRVDASSGNRRCHQCRLENRRSRYRSNRPKLLAAKRTAYALKHS